MTPLPPQPNDPPPRRGNPLVLLLVLVIGFASVVGLMLFYPPLAFGAAGVFGFAALHYLLWGWWLGGMIRREVAEEESGGRRSEVGDQSAECGVRNAECRVKKAQLPTSDLNPEP